MALLNEGEVRARGRRAAEDDRRRRNSYTTRDTREILRESVLAYSGEKIYDMFVSHSAKDAELILGVKSIFEDLGYSPYVDWIDDPHLDRNNVTSKTADVLRNRMRSSKSLMYVTTSNSDSSRWMPWECGYFDGFRQKVAIVPVLEPASSEFLGLEYLGLYPYCEKAKGMDGIERLYVQKDKSIYTTFDNWVKNKESDVYWRT